MVASHIICNRFLTALAIYSGAISNILVISAFVVFINKFQIEPEEDVLLEKFGESYEKYKDNVGRWM